MAADDLVVYWLTNNGTTDGEIMSIVNECMINVPIEDDAIVADGDGLISTRVRVRHRQSRPSRRT